jgi:hypothetical protein
MSSMKTWVSALIRAWHASRRVQDVRETCTSWLCWPQHNSPESLYHLRLGDPAEIWLAREQLRRRSLAATYAALADV